MTKEDFKAKVADIKRRKAELDAELSEAKKQYIADNADQTLIDKKVRVVTKDHYGATREIVAWLGGYELRWEGTEITPILFKDKKTGGRSLQRTYIYSKVVLIEEYKEA